jgi:hypothetical protein
MTLRMDFIVPAALVLMAGVTAGSRALQGQPLDNVFGLFVDYRLYLALIGWYVVKSAVQAMEQPDDNSGPLYRWLYTFGHQLMMNVQSAAASMRAPVFRRRDQDAPPPPNVLHRHNQGERDK